MRAFNEALHTPDSLYAQLDALSISQPDMRIVGSLGRSVLYGKFYGDPQHEYSIRDEIFIGTPEKARDIDVVNADMTRLTSAEAEPFEIDPTGFSNALVRLVQENNTWFLTSSRQNFAEELHPAVMEPVTGRSAAEAIITTVPAQTHIVLYGMNGNIRAQDELTREAMHKLRRTLPKSSQLSPDMYEPFERLRDLNDADIYIRVRNTYRRMIPEAMRRRLMPVVKTLHLSENQRG